MNCHLQVIAADGEQKAARALKVKILLKKITFPPENYSIIKNFLPKNYSTQKNDPTTNFPPKNYSTLKKTKKSTQPPISVAGGIWCYCSLPRRSPASILAGNIYFLNYFLLLLIIFQIIFNTFSNYFLIIFQIIFKYFF